MKVVSDKTTGEIITIDETKEPKWMEKYNHRNGKPFEVKPVEEMSVEELETIVKNKKDNKTVEQNDSKDDTSDEVEQTPIEEIQAQYEAKFGKKPAPAYKNRREWLLDKINS